MTPTPSKFWLHAPLEAKQHTNVLFVMPPTPDTKMPWDILQMTVSVKDVGKELDFGASANIVMNLVLQLEKNTFTASIFPENIAIHIAPTKLASSKYILITLKHI